MSITGKIVGVGNLDTCLAITSSFGSRSTVAMFFSIEYGLL